MLNGSHSFSDGWTTTQLAPRPLLPADFFFLSTSSSSSSLRRRRFLSFLFLEYPPYLPFQTILDIHPSCKLQQPPHTSIENQQGAAGTFTLPPLPSASILLFLVQQSTATTLVTRLSVAQRRCRLSVQASSSISSSVGVQHPPARVFVRPSVASRNLRRRER